MQNCPSCGEKTISNYDKFMLGPARTIECGNCNARVSISWYTMIGIAIMIKALNQIRNTDNYFAYFLMFTTYCVIYMYVHWKFVPLRVRK